MTELMITNRRLTSLNEAAAAFTAVCGSEHHTNAIRATLRQLVHRENDWNLPLLIAEFNKRKKTSVFEIGLRRYDFLVYVDDTFKTHPAFKHYVEQVLELLAVEQYLTLRGKLMEAGGSQGQ